LPPPTSAGSRWCSRGTAISGTDTEHPPRSASAASGSSRTFLYALLLAGIAVYFVVLGNASIWDANEAFYVETPREMLEAHDLVNPSFNYLPRFNKPVLSYWIVAAIYKSFGVSVAAQRFGIALGAMIIIAAAFVLGGIQESRLRMMDSALFAAAGLAASPRLVMFARRIFIDIWVSAFLALTLTFFALSETRPERRRLYLTLMYVAVGLGVLTKGPVYAGLPGLAFALYLIVTRELRRVTEMMIPLGIVIVAVIVVPWYAVLYQQHGWTYIKSFLVTENLERFTEGVGVLQRRGPSFYPPVVFSDSFPLSLLLPAAAVAAWREPSRLQRLLWCWIVAIVGFFSFSVGKQDLYIFPIAPAVAALGGAAIGRGLSDERWRGWLRWTLTVAGVLLALAGAGVLLLFETAGRVYMLNGATTIGAIAIAGGVGALALSVARRPRWSVLTLLAATVAINWVFVVRVLPDFERYKPVPYFSRTLQSRLEPDDIVAEYHVALPSLVYYLRRHVDQYFDPEPFVEAMLGSRHVYATLSADDYRGLSPRLASGTCVIERRPTFDVKLGQVLARDPLPELLLISNHCPGVP
jgi:4-amino-4-deoxy-L-arabinose transferase-like glycosyltransferase